VEEKTTALLNKQMLYRYVVFSFCLFGVLLTFFYRISAFVSALSPQSAAASRRLEPTPPADDEKMVG
jgi:hypothetical protein